MLICVGTLVAVIWSIALEAQRSTFGGAPVNFKDVSELSAYLFGIWIAFCLALYATGWGIAWAIAGFSKK